MITAILLLLIISISGNESSSEPDDRCPTLSALDCLNFRILASSTCGDNNSSNQYCYGSSPTIKCSACENEDDVNVRNAVDLDPSTHWISRPGLEAANLTVDLIQVVYVCYLTNVGRSRGRRKVLVTAGVEAGVFSRFYNICSYS